MCTQWPCYKNHPQHSPILFSSVDAAVKKMTTNTFELGCATAESLNQHLGWLGEHKIRSLLWNTRYIFTQQHLCLLYTRYIISVDSFLPRNLDLMINFQPSPARKSSPRAILHPMTWKGQRFVQKKNILVSGRKRKSRSLTVTSEKDPLQFSWGSMGQASFFGSTFSKAAVRVKCCKKLFYKRKASHI